MTWTPIAVFPNVEVVDPIEGSHLALVPPTHPSVVAAKAAHPVFKTFMGRFTDTFGAKFEPSVLTRKFGAPPSMCTMEAVASFRDAIAAAVVLRGRARYIIYERSGGIYYSDAFWMFPWMVDRSNKRIIANTPAMLALDHVTKLRAQSSPDASRVTLRRSDIDTPLLNTLLSEWTTRFRTKTPSWRSLALFRSLNMANEAMKAPSGADSTFYDYGRSLPLWVSAFEILVHPGTVPGSTERMVRAHLDQVRWEHRALKAKRYTISPDPSRPRVTLAGWLYRTIHTRRNDFLHGNPVKRNALLVPVSGRSLLAIAAPLYRAALTSFLDLTWQGTIPNVSEPEAFARSLSDNMTFSSHQRLVEEALLMSRAKSKDMKANRKAITESRRRRPKLLS